MLGYIGIPLYFSRLLATAGIDAGRHAQQMVDDLSSGSQTNVNKGGSTAFKAGKKLKGLGK
jgi:hypothetical protein